jgi:hypothetical protein
MAVKAIHAALAALLIAAPAAFAQDQSTAPSKPAATEAVPIKPAADAVPIKPTTDAAPAPSKKAVTHAKKKKKHHKKTTATGTGTSTGTGGGSSPPPPPIKPVSGDASASPPVKPNN